LATFETRKTIKGRRRTRAVVRRKGFPVVRATFDRKLDAETWARQVETDMASGRYQATQANVRTVGDMVSRYIVEVCPKTKTGAHTAQQLRAWRDLIGEQDVRAVRPSDVASARDQLGTGRAAGTTVRYLAALSRCFTVAIRDWQWLDVNPCKKITWPKESRGRVRFLDDDERNRLLAACRASKCRRLADIVMVAMLTGMRRGEILGLRWGDIDLERRRIILEETKNDERRRVPLSSDAVAILQDRQPPNARPDYFVFHSPRTRERPLNIEVAWQKALKLARVKDFRFHDLRHTAASYLAMSGATTQEIAEILGHKTLAMVKRYAHLTEAHSIDVVERMQERMFDNK